MLSLIDSGSSPARVYTSNGTIPPTCRRFPTARWQKRRVRRTVPLSTNYRTAYTRKGAGRCSWCSAGKDGTILHVFRETGPRGVTVTAFRRPSEEELAHDFLWRAHLASPRRGYVGIFNRSHYEDVLAVPVRKLMPREIIEQRYEQINAFEKMLSENGTTILKFMLHISKKEQRERLQARLDDAKSRWKFDPGDLGDRKLWDEYQSAYEIMLNKCSTRWAPWHVIPADRKWARNAAVAAIVRETLEAMNPKYPKPAWNSREFKVQ